MGQNIIYSTWEGTRGPWFCLMNKLLLFGLLWLLSFGPPVSSHTMLTDDPPVILGRRLSIHCVHLLLMMKVTCECPETVLHPKHIARWRYFELHWSMWSGLWHRGWSAMPEGSPCTGVGLNRGGIHPTTSGSFTFISISTIHRSKALVALFSQKTGIYLENQQV